MGKRRRPDAPVRCPTAYNSHYAIRLAPSQSRARRSHEQTSGNANGRSDRVPEHSRAGVRGLNRVIAMGRYFATGSQMTCRVARKIA